MLAKSILVQLGNFTSVILLDLTALYSYKRKDEMMYINPCPVGMDQ